MTSINKTIEAYEKKKILLKLIKNVKSGKEATVYLMQDKNSQLLALKIYKDIYIRSFHRRDNYLQGIYIDKPSLRHAVAKKTKLGREYIQERWILKEVEIFNKLNKAESLVPHLYAHTSNSLLMEYLGTIVKATPRLIDTKIHQDQIENFYLSIFETFQSFLDAGYAHGDLSEYNILVWNNMPFFIDFPQAVDLKTNPNSLDIFMRDINKISLYFEKEYNYKNLDVEDSFKIIVQERFLKGF